VKLDYITVRQVHVTAAALSITLFVARTAWLARAPGRVQRRWMRSVPQVVDTVLLASALWLAWQLGVAGTRGWLWAKLIALVLYVALGTITLRAGRPARVRMMAFVGAIATFAYVAGVAITKSPLSVLSWALT
jgi:uncharacterized membrane protein SirB2